MTLRNHGGRCGAWHGFVGAIMLGVILFAGSPAIAEEGAPSTALENVGLEVSSWLLTAPYGAAKAAYALGGSIVGGLAWLVTGGDTEVAKSIWVPAIAGDYIVRPENLTGDRPIHFVGKGSESE
jgi:hypothetical protein